MKLLEVFADVACPFTHVGFVRFDAYRLARGTAEPILSIRAWPLESVNGQALDGPSLVPKIRAIQGGVAPELFTGFDPGGFPATTTPALAAAAAAYRQSPEVGERFSLAVRWALFEDGLDVSDDGVLQTLRDAQGVAEPTNADRASVHEDFLEGQRRGVVGTPHFFTADGGFFCPSLDIRHDDDGYDVSFDTVAFHRFVSAVFD